MLLTRSPLIQPNKSQVFSVRLACVKHAASVRPEPGSNSPNKNKNVKAQKNQPTKQTRPASNPNQKHSKTKNRHKKQTNTLSSSQTTPTQSSAHSTSHAHSIGDSRHVSATQASRFVRCRSAQQEKQYARPSGPSNHNGPLASQKLFRGIPGFTADFCPQNAQNSALFMSQNTEYQIKCVPGRAISQDDPACRSGFIPRPSHLLPETLPSVDLGAILASSERHRRIRQC